MKIALDKLLETVPWDEYIEIRKIGSLDNLYRGQAMEICETDIDAESYEVIEITIAPFNTLRIKVS